MRHMLASNTAKPQIPVPNSQLAKLLKQLQLSRTGITKPVVSVAKQKFLDLGWELCELGSGAGKHGSQTTASNLGTCIVVYVLAEGPGFALC